MMMALNSKIQLFAGILTSSVLLLVLGCGGSDTPKTVAVSGIVTLQGTPLPAGSVSFIPMDKANRPASGEIGSDGSYQLSSFQQGDGVMPGEYQVTVESYESRPTRIEPNKPYVSRIPKRYANSAESGLKYTVPTDADRSLVFNIDLKP